jgi:hypothetical protein
MKFFRACPTESIEWLIEDQTFSPSYDLAPPLAPIPLSHQHGRLSFSVFLCVAGRAYRQECEEGAKIHATSRKPGPQQIIQYTLMPDISSPAGMKFPPDLVWIAKGMVLRKRFGIDRFSARE